MGRVRQIGLRINFVGDFYENIKFHLKARPSKKLFDDIADSGAFYSARAARSQFHEMYFRSFSTFRRNWIAICGALHGMRTAREERQRNGSVSWIYSQDWFYIYINDFIMLTTNFWSNYHKFVRTLPTFIIESMLYQRIPPFARICQLTLYLFKYLETKIFVKICVMWQ